MSRADAEQALLTMTGERVATLVVDRETRYVHEWHIEGEDP